MLQDIREYELDYEAAKKAAAVAAVEAEKEEERRIKLLEKNPLGELTIEEEEDINFGEGPLSVQPSDCHFCVFRWMHMQVMQVTVKLCLYQHHGMPPGLLAA